MRWEDERWVKTYTRDTADWLVLSFEAQGLFGLLMRKVDGAGIIDLGRRGKQAIGVVVGHPTRTDVLAKALDELLEDGCVVLKESKLVLRNFVAAQEAKTSDSERKRRERERDRDLALAESPAVTPSHEPSRDVTAAHQPEERDQTRSEERDLKNAPAASPPVAHAPKVLEHISRLKTLPDRLALLFERLRGSKYKHMGAKDTDGLKRLIAVATDEEIEGEWARVLTLPRDDWLSCNTFAQLDSKWNDLTAPDKEKRRYG